MKRMYIGIAFLLSILVLGWTVTAVFNRIYSPMEDALDRAGKAALAEDWETAETLVQEVQERWQRYRNLTAAVADHEPVEEFDALLAQVEVYLQRDSAAFAALCTQLSRVAAAMGDSQAINWWSLM